eukprot:TRINITY_DN6546_c0_g1_i1.p1 TRINITY_DN6546_c0_g1~~TRINITY_DN6546_c0_g1_i1.p1  ORF type:complete len:318 (-),score=89.66 TRINITY_DN6546_c0_g1_i1:28-981(-)
MCSRSPKNNNNIPQDYKIHDKVKCLKPFLGVWKGKGKGVYPTIDSFEYFEEASFSTMGKPFVYYQQKTKNLNDEPLHTETGYFRVRKGENDEEIVELVVTDPTGTCQMYDGEITITKSTEEENNVEVIETTLSLNFTKIITTPSSKAVTALNRVIRISQQYELDSSREIKSSLDYSVEMEAVEQPLQNHLKANLFKQVPPDYNIYKDEFNEILSNSNNNTKYNLDNTVIVDIREPDEFEKNGFKDKSVNLPMGKFLHEYDHVDTPTYDIFQEYADKTILLLCNTSFRTEVAIQSILNDDSFKFTANLIHLKNGLKSL